MSRLAGAVVLALVTAGSAQAASKAAPAAKTTKVAKAAATSAPWATPAFAAAAGQLDTTVRGMIEKTVARADGYLYGMDVAPLLLYAAERKDEALYTSLLPKALKLVVSGGEDAATEGFVLWRQKDGVNPEITGAEETLWMARALWAGAHAFNRAGDRALVAKVVAGYARHASEPHGVWSVSKYYAFASRSFASMSVLPAYQADFLTETESLAPGAKGFGQRSYTAMQRALSPSKLLLPLMQPELGEHFAGMNAQRFAPDDVVMLGDSCLGAEGAQRGLPEIARGVLAFAGDASRLNRDGRLYAYYQRRTGKVVGEAVLGSSGYACLARMAAAFGDHKAARALQPALTGDMMALAAAGDENAAPLYSAGPLLRAANALHVFQ